MMRAVTLCAETSLHCAFRPWKPSNEADLPAKTAVTMLTPTSPPPHVGQN